MNTTSLSGLDDPSALDLYPPPDHGPVSSFFLGALFITCLHYIAISFFSSFVARLPPSQQWPTTTVTPFPTLEDGLDARDKSVSALATIAPAQRNKLSVTTFLAANLGSVLAVCLAISSLSQMASLLAFSPIRGPIGCAFFVVIGGLFSRLAGLVALVSLSLDLRDLGAPSWEHGSFLGFIGVAFIVTCIEQGFSVGVLRSVSSLPFGFCTRNPSVTFYITNSTLVILASMYTSTRLFSSILPHFFTRSDLIHTVADGRVARSLSLLLFNILVFIPEILSAGVVGNTVPFVVGALVVTVLFNRVPSQVRSAPAHSTLPQPYSVAPVSRHFPKGSVTAKRVSLDAANTVPKSGLAAESTNAARVQYIELYPAFKSPSNVTSPTSPESFKVHQQLRTRSMSVGASALALSDRAPDVPAKRVHPFDSISSSVAGPPTQPTMPPDTPLILTLMEKLRRSRSTAQSSRSTPRSTRNPQQVIPSLEPSASVAEDVESVTTASSSRPTEIGPGALGGEHPPNAASGRTYKRIVSHLSSLVPPSPITLPPSSFGTPLPSLSKPSLRIDIPTTPQRSHSRATTVGSDRPLSFLASQNPNTFPASFLSVTGGRSTPARSGRGSPNLSETEGCTSDEFALSATGEMSPPCANRMSIAGTFLERPSTAGTFLERPSTAGTPPERPSTAGTGFSKRSASSKQPRKEERRRDRSAARRTFGATSRLGTGSSKRSSASHNWDLS